MTKNLGQKVNDNATDEKENEPISFIDALKRYTDQVEKQAQYWISQ